MVTLMPDFSFSLLVATRKASRSVMSASSWLVTAGIRIALRSRLAPLIFLMRLKSLRSIGPNLAKSMLGHGIRPRPAPSLAAEVAGLALCWAAMAAVCTAPLITERVKACTSLSRMRPLRPLPLTSPKGTPSSRANLRTDGEACGRFSGEALVSWAGKHGGVRVMDVGLNRSAVSFDQRFWLSDDVGVSKL
ncbi:hypothetical protein GALL_473940 [mine drainage metagenome]|uniref:Uncharacterized protein n=1 Tax=mine drainage metagenome TaxID=410659 RepID=A0A1J5PHQ7_9ZZZZ